MNIVKVDGETMSEGEMKVLPLPCIPLFIDVVKGSETKTGIFVEDSLK
jgi:hypothetical protein